MILRIYYIKFNKIQILSKNISALSNCKLFYNIIWWYKVLSYLIVYLRKLFELGEEREKKFKLKSSKIMYSQGMLKYTHIHLH